MADLVEIEVPGVGRIRTAVSPDRLAEFGVNLAPPPPETSLFRSGATAQNDGGGGVGNVPATASDAGGASGRTANEGTGHQPSAAEAEPKNVDAKPSADQQEFEKKQAGLRGGGEVVDIDTGDTGPAQQPQGPPPVSYRTIRAGDTKGADIRTGFSVKKTGATDLLPEYDAQLVASSEKQKQALKEQNDIRKDELERIRGAEEENRIRLEVQRDAQEAKLARERAAQEDLATKTAALDAEHERFQKLEINPNQYWDGLSTGSKILAAISMIAGGIQSARKGGPNQAIELIHRSIRDDIARQREKMEARRQGFNIEKTALEKKAELLGGNVKLAEQELEANMQAAALTMMRRDKAITDAAMLDPNLQLALAQVDEQLANTRMNVAAQNGVQIQEQHAFVPDRVVAVGGAAPVKPEVRERKVELGDGRFGYARSAAQAKEAQDKLTPGSDIIAGLNELRALRNASSEVDVTPTQMSAIKQRMRAIALGLAPRMNVQVGQGAMSEDEVKQNMNKMGDPEAVVKGAADAAIEETIRIQERANRSIARDYLYADPDATTPLLRGQPQGGLQREQ